jgi:hypothetical protein
MVPATHAAEARPRLQRHDVGRHLDPVLIETRLDRLDGGIEHDDRIATA